MKMSNERLRELCIKHQWFTEGTNTQYDRLFYANAHGASAEEIATIIWLCSDTEVRNRNEIKAVLERESVPGFEYKVWCVDSAYYLLSGMIHCSLFADYESAEAYYNRIGEGAYRKIYLTPDIWGWTERQWQNGGDLV